MLSMKPICPVSTDLGKLHPPSPSLCKTAEYSAEKLPPAPLLPWRHPPRWRWRSDSVNVCKLGHFRHQEAPLKVKENFKLGGNQGIVVRLHKHILPQQSPSQRRQKCENFPWLKISKEAKNNASTHRWGCQCVRWNHLSLLSSFVLEESNICRNPCTICPSTIQFSGTQQWGDKAMHDKAG